MLRRLAASRAMRRSAAGAGAAALSRTARGSAAAVQRAAPVATRIAVAACRARAHQLQPVRAFSTPVNTAQEAYAQVFQHWTRLNLDGLAALRANELDKAEARFIAAANVCATFTQTVATANLYSGLVAGVVNPSAGAAAPPAVHRALSLHNLGVVYVKMGKTRDSAADSAKKVFREAIAILRSYSLSDYQVLGNVHRELAALYEAEQNWREAAEQYQNAYTYFDRSHHPHAPQQAALSLYSMALVAHKQRGDGGLDEAEKHYRAALDLATLAYGRKHKNVGQVLYSLGHLLIDKQQFSKAKDYYMKAAQVLQEAGDSTFLKAMADYMEVVARLGEDDADARVAAKQQAAAAASSAPLVAGKGKAAVAKAKGGKAAPVPPAGGADAAAAAAAAPTEADTARAKALREVGRIEQLKPQQQRAAYARLQKALKTDEWQDAWAKEYEEHQRKTKEDDAKDESERQLALAAHLQRRREANEAQGVPTRTVDAAPADAAAARDAP